ncbi:hypothetical protein Efla_007425 [Eimeria flavescens]
MCRYVLNFVLRVDVQCPVEAVKLFGRAEQLLPFKEKATLVRHFPSGELLLRPDDYMAWDKEGKAFLQRARGSNTALGSFWTRHQTRIHSSDRQAVLFKPPSFDDPLDKDMSRRLPSLWEPQPRAAFQKFKLPAFAASSSSSSSPSEASPRGAAAAAPAADQPAAAPALAEQLRIVCISEVPSSSNTSSSNSSSSSGCR